MDAKKPPGSGMRRAVEGEEGRSAIRAVRRDSQARTVGLMVGLVVLAVGVLWVRSDLLSRLKETRGQLAEMPAGLKAAAQKSVVDALKPQMDATGARLESLEREVTNLQSDMKALRADLQARIGPAASARPQTGARPETTTGGPAAAGDASGRARSRVDEAVSNAVGDVP